MGDTILLVDDEEGIRKVLGISLADRGYTVHTAGSAQEALQVFRREKPAIVLTDINMPDMDGIELLRRVKQENPETEVIMFTGQGDMDLAIRSLKHDATDFVTKPIDDDILNIAIKRARERIAMRRQIREYTENLERLVQEKAAQLVEAERMAAIGQTIAGLSHTIKNIAGGLRGGIFVLGQGIEQDDKRSLLEGWEMVKGNVDKIRTLSLDLLNYGKYAELNFTHCSPNRPAEEAAELMRARAEEFGIRFRCDLDSSLKSIRCDSEAVLRCLLNLISNAIDACREDPMPDKEKEVVLQTAPADSWGIEYRVSDTGSGMDEETRSRIFQSFFSTKGTQGTGIGLMMTRKIVDRHGGKISVASEKGIGSTFTIRLPRANASRDEVSASSRKE